MTNIEIRVGSEDPDLGDPGLLNQKCGYITAPQDERDKRNGALTEKINDQEILNVIVNCSDASSVGRFLTIQKLGSGQLEIYEIMIYPKPGKTLLLLEGFSITCMLFKCLTGI